MRPDSHLYFPPNPIVRLLHRCCYSHTSMTRFSPGANRRPARRRPHHLFGHLPPPSGSCRRIYNVSSTGKLPDRTNQQLNGDAITSSVRPINDLVNIVIHMLFAFAGPSSVEREWKNKITQSR